jgi:predicted nucleotidyltransferase
MLLTVTQRAEIMARIKALLTETFGDRLRGVILYGSEARGEATEDSDIDLLVVLARDASLDDSDACIHALYDLVLEIERPIHCYPVNIGEYEKQEWPLYKEVKREGIAL